MRQKFIVIFVFLTISLSAWFGFYIQSVLKLNPNTILPNIYIDQMLVGNLTKSKALALIKNKYAKTNDFKINLYFRKKKTATFTAKTVEYKLPIKSVVDQAFLVGRGKGLSALYQKLALNWGWEKYNFEINPSYNNQYLKQALSEMAQSYKKNPVDARFDFQNNKVQAFKVEQDGYEMDISNIQAKIEHFFNQQKKKPINKIEMTIPQKVLYAKIKLANINDLGVKEVVGQGTSLFAGSAPERVHNIVTGANKINGLIIKPSQVFSFQEFLGEISKQTGFASAYVIKNGKTVLDDGGGICQVSTTMFRTALNAGLPIVERTAHAYRVGYYEQDSKPGLDATIYLPSVDLKFKNDYSSALLIQSEIDLNEMRLTFTLYGTKDNRKAEISEISVWNVSRAPEAEYIDDYTLPEGVVKQVDFAAPGASAKFTYKVSYPNGEIKEEEFVSNYRPWKAIYLVGKKTG